MPPTAILVLVLATVTCAILIPDLPTASYRVPGDFNIGVILPVHKYCLDDFCHQRVRDLGMLQRIEAVAFAVREINERQDILPGHTLGFIMYDDCYKDITALGQALHFIEHDSNTCLWSRVDGGCSQQELEMQNVVAVLGSEGSTPTTQLANLFSSLQIPQVSYIATSPILDNRHRYGNLVRMVPSDVHQVKVIVSLLEKFDWRYVNVLYSEGYYGDNAYKAFVNEIDSRKSNFITNDKSKDICVASVFEIKRSYTIGDYKNVVNQLLQGHTKASVVILFVPVYEGLKIIDTAKLLFSTGFFTWIASDAFARSVEELHGLADEMKGSLSINFDVPSVGRFNDYFSNLGPLSSTGNPWLQEFARDHFECDLDQSSPELVNCNDPTLRFADNDYFFPDHLVALVIDAVYTIAHGLHDALQEEPCGQSPNSQCPEHRFCYNLSGLVFEGETGTVKINENGSVAQSYVVHNIQEINGSYEFVPVAFWNLSAPDSMEGELVFDDNSIQWAKDSQPESICSRPCGVGQAPALEQVTCCWVCYNCSDNCIVDSYYKRCTQCAEGTWPDQETRSECLEIIPVHLQFTHELGIILSISSLLGCLACLTVGIIAIKHRAHGAIKAASRELAAIMLMGLMQSYLFIFLYIAQPSSTICYFRGLGWGLCFTLMYAPIVTRTFRILRIFRAGQALRKNPGCVGSKAQVAIVFAIIILHAVLLVGLASAYRPYPVEVTTSPGHQVITCAFLSYTFLASCLFNGVLLLIAVVLAFKTRTVPDRYNESRYISFSVYCTVIIQMAFVPAYYAVDDPFDQIMFLGLTIIITATVILLFIFMPKMYAIYFMKDDEPQVFAKSMRQRRRSRRVATTTSSICSQQSIEQTRKKSTSIVSIFSVSSHQVNPPDLLTGSGVNGFKVSKTLTGRSYDVTQTRKTCKESSDSDA